MPTWNVAAYPVVGSPTGVTISDDRLSAKMPSAVFAIGLLPREAYAPLRCTVALTLSVKAICVTFRETPPLRYAARRPHQERKARQSSPSVAWSRSASSRTAMTSDGVSTPQRCAPA